VFQLLKRHFSRYTVEMVEQVTGCTRETFLNVAETILANSGRERTTAWAYAVGWTQHTYGPQLIGLLRAAAAPPGEHWPCGRRHHGLTRSCLDPGLN
jgi:anaerobic selenocysteine-containing dehydrogenase